MSIISGAVCVLSEFMLTIFSSIKHTKKLQFSAHHRGDFFHHKRIMLALCILELKRSSGDFRKIIPAAIFSLFHCTYSLTDDNSGIFHVEERSEISPEKHRKNEILIILIPPQDIQLCMSTRQSSGRVIE